MTEVPAMPALEGILLAARLVGAAIVVVVVVLQVRARMGFRLGAVLAGAAIHLVATIWLIAVDDVDAPRAVVSTGLAIVLLLVALLAFGRRRLARTQQARLRTAGANPIAGAIDESGIRVLFLASGALAVVALLLAALWR